MNYLSFGGLFSLRYAYVDLNTNENYAADSLFYKRKIPVKFGDEMSRDGDRYRVVFCKVHKKYRKPFEEALEELKTKMNLLGYTDYEDYCNDLMKQMEKES